MIKSVYSGVLLLILGAWSASGQTITPAPANLRIVGTIGESNAFEGGFTLTASEPVENLAALSGRLETSSGHAIEAFNVTVTGDSALEANVPEQFRVAIADVIEPGTYTGAIDVLLPGGPSQSARVPIEIVAEAVPNLTPIVADNLQLKLVSANCNLWIKCRLIRWLLPAGARIDAMDIVFENDTKADARVSEATTVLSGEHGGTQLGAEVAVVVPTAIAAGRVGSLRVNLNRRAIPPDHYQGLILLKIDNRDGLIRIPVDLSMRVGAWWPAVLILIGLLLGRLVKKLQDQQAGTKRQKVGDRLLQVLFITSGVAGTGWKDVWRVVLWVVTIAALLWIGLESLYVNSGASLGANPASDYLGLVVWGLGSDIASRTLSNLPR